MEFTVDCRTCVRQHTSSCDDCVVTFLSGREPDEAVVVDASEFAALRRLDAAGLISNFNHDDGRAARRRLGESRTGRSERGHHPSAGRANRGSGEVRHLRDAG